MPGVSRSAICPRLSFRMPTMRLRVVCGLFETIDTFWPRMRFRRVALPALGRPTRATVPKQGLIVPSLCSFSDMVRLPVLSCRLPEAQRRQPATGNRSLSHRFVFLRLRLLRHAHAVDAAAVGALDREPVAVLHDR